MENLYQDEWRQLLNIFKWNISVLYHYLFAYNFLCFIIQQVRFLKTVFTLIFFGNLYQSYLATTLLKKSVQNSVYWKNQLFILAQMSSHWLGFSWLRFNSAGLGFRLQVRSNISHISFIILRTAAKLLKAEA